MVYLLNSFQLTDKKALLYTKLCRYHMRQSNNDINRKTPRGKVKPIECLIEIILFFTVFNLFHYFNLARW
ncbi:MAG: hypothetical protein ACI9N3_002370 [Colwellia sp.]|jgi:hypothetical protein